MSFTKNWPEYITRELVLEQHELMLRKYGGASGIRDEGLLASALALPEQSAFGEAMYPTPHDQAAAFTVSLVCNHPFIDGNKRTAIRVSAAWLFMNGYHRTATDDETYAFIVEVAEGKIDMDAAKVWYCRNYRPA